MPQTKAWLALPWVVLGVKQNEIINLNHARPDGPNTGTGTWKEVKDKIYFAQGKGGEKKKALLVAFYY